MRSGRATILILILVPISFLFVCMMSSAMAADTGKIVGELTDAKTGEPIVGGSVMVVNTKRGAMTDYDGKYVIDQLPPGIYTLKISHLDYETVTVEGVEVRIDISEECSHELTRKVEPEITLRPPGPITRLRKVKEEIVLNKEDVQSKIWGVMTDAEGGRPIKGASVIVVGMDLRTVTDSKGNFVIQNVPDGSYQIVFSCKGYKTTRVEEVSVGPGHRARLHLRVERIVGGKEGKK